MKLITIWRLPQATIVMLCVMLCVHVALCHPAATSRGYPAIHPFWETVAPVLIYFAAALLPFFDDDLVFRRRCRRVFIPVACLVSAIAGANLMDGRPRYGSAVGMLGLLVARPVEIASLTLVWLAFLYPISCVIETAANSLWARLREFAEPGTGAPLVRFTMKGLLAALAVASLMLSTCLWARRAYTTWPRWELSHQCDLNLRRIGLAMQNYHALYGSFPPAYVADSTGKPMHSWRVLLLPMLEQQQLYDAYRFDEPWNGPHNQLLARRIPDVYRCSWDVARTSNDTSYVVAVGTATLFPGSESTTMVPDGTSNTLLAFEVAESGINWLEPRDLPFDQIHFEQHSTDCVYPRFNHNGKRKYAIHAIFADGHRVWSDTMPLETLRALLTANGGETITGNW